MLNSGPPDVPSPFDDFEVSSQERISERIGDQIVDVPLPQNLEERLGRGGERVQELTIEQIGGQIVECASASNYARNHRGPCSSVAPAPPATFDDPAPEIEHVAPACAVTFDEPARVIEYVAPAPADPYATPAPVIEYVMPSPVVEYITPAPSVTLFAPG